MEFEASQSRRKARSLSAEVLPVFAIILLMLYIVVKCPDGPIGIACVNRSQVYQDGSPEQSKISIHEKALVRRKIAQ